MQIGGVQLLDTVEASSSGVTKPTDYFESLNVDNYDLILITCASDDCRGSVLLLPSQLVWKSGLLVSIQLRVNGSALIQGAWTPDQWKFKGLNGYAGTFNIYGIKL